MFGFVRPLKPELRVRELDRFGQMYCGLCATLKKRYGYLQTTFLSYDLTFFALLLDALRDQPPQIVRGRCPVNPLRRKPMQAENEVLAFTADVHVLLTYHKVCDSVADERGIKRVGAKILRALCTSAYRKAAALHPQMDASLADCMQQLAQVEAAKTDSLDRPADCFARMLAACAPAQMEGDTARVLHQLFYHLGRWIYLVDACYDLTDDLKAGAYNPVALRFGLTEPQLATVQQPLTHTLERSLLDIYAAFQLLPIQRDGDLLLNIITLGLPVTTTQVLDQTYQANGGQGRHGSL